MIKCRKCNVTISDNTNICPLCSCAVNSDKTSKTNEPSYPAVWLKERKLKRACNISLFAALMAAVILAVCNYAFYSGHWWCVIPVAAMAYVWFVFRLVLVSRKGYRAKVFIPLIFALGLVLLIDAETGFYRWSLNFVLPGGILLADLLVVILMLTNLKNWQSYIIMQIGMLAASLVPLVLWAAGIITSPLMTIIVSGVTLFLFLGTVIVGDRDAKQELKRRFHIK